MRGFWFARAVIFASLVLALCAVSATLGFGQQQEPGSGGTPITRELPIKHAPGTRLTEQEIRGAGLFTQRCALCHLPKTFGAGGAKFCCMPPVEPMLIGSHLFKKDMTPNQEAGLRSFIMNGGPTLMPAFKYGLDSKEIDDIIAYLKTLI
jgi:mono/diheme cytochrome c family protein